jgi:hypothetical protein
VIRHGTHNAYGNGRCRCDACRAAWKVYCRERRRRHSGLGLPPYVAHGTHNAYTNYLCRCVSCRAANSAYNRAWRASRKVAAS